MKLASKLLGAASTAALLSMAPTAAHAAGTAAGTSITNNVSVNFNVGGVAQTATGASNTIVVDNKIVFTVAEQGAITSVSPGQTGAVTTFKVTNSSNTTIDVGLAAAAQSNGATAAHGGTVNQTVTGYTYWLDTSGTGIYNAGTVTQVTWLDEIAPDASKTVFVLANVPAGAVNAQIAGINLTGTAEAGGSTGTQGAVLTASTGAWTPGTVQTVLADGTGNGTGDANYDGKYTALGDYSVAAAVLSVNKNSIVVSDPVNGSTNAKSIPGATMQYCIVVANAAGAGASATNLNISDVLPANITYKANSVVLNTAVTGSGSSASCGAGTAGSDATNWNAGTTTVSGALANLAAGASEGLSFQVTIN